MPGAGAQVPRLSKLRRSGTPARARMLAGHGRCRRAHREQHVHPPRSTPTPRRRSPTGSPPRSRLATGAPLLFEPVARHGRTSSSTSSSRCTTSRRVLPESIGRLHAYLTVDRSRSRGGSPSPTTRPPTRRGPWPASWPRTCRGVRALHLDAKGRGRALRAAWSGSDAAVVAYMDVDLSTDLDALLPLVAPLVSGHSDVAIGTRLASTAQVSRGPRREAVSRLLQPDPPRRPARRLLRRPVRVQGRAHRRRHGVAADGRGPGLVLRHRAARARRAQRHAHPRGARRLGGRSRLTGPHRLDGARRPARRVAADARLRPRRRRAARRRWPTPRRRTKRPTLEQLVRFVSIGAVSTVLFAVLFLLLHDAVGAVAADVIALAVCTVVNTVANRRLTFNLRGRTRRVRHQLRGLVAGLFPLGLNLLALAVAAAFGVTEAVPLVLVLTVANAVASLAKFVLLQHWVFVSRPVARPLTTAPPRRPFADRTRTAAGAGSMSGVSLRVRLVAALAVLLVVGLDPVRFRHLQRLRPAAARPARREPPGRGTPRRPPARRRPGPLPAVPAGAATTRAPPPVPGRRRPTP